MVNDNNYKKILKKGTINNKKLLDYFGTPSNIAYYKKNKKIVNSTKKRLLEKASRYCEIKDISNGKYKICNIHKELKPAILNKINTGMYQYLAPIILLKLIKEHDVDNKIILPIIDYARYIEMINHNYKTVKYNQEHTSNEFKLNNDVTREFFEKVDNNIKYYIHNCLEFLKQADVLKWYKVPMVKKKETNITVVDDKNIAVECDYKDVRATSEEVNFYIKTSESIREELKIEKASECFYGSKAFDFCNMLSDRLKEKNIMYFYDSYEIYYTNLDRCKKLFKEFKQCNEEDILIKEFNKFFIEYIINKAELRKNKQKELENELHKYRLDDNYIANIKTLSDLTIDINTEKYRIKKQSNASYMEKIDEDFGLTVNKKYKDKTIKKEI